MCARCNGEGKIAYEVFSGAWMFEGCNCKVAEENEKDLLESFEKIRQGIHENMIRVTS